MSSYKNLFPGLTSLPARTPVTTSTSEISLRDELNDILHGTKGSVPKGQTFLLRRMRRDSSNNLISCHCVDVLTLEGDQDYFCGECLGESRLWDEEVVIGYKASISSSKNSRGEELSKESPGLLSLPAYTFYFEYLTDLTLEDRIILIKLDLEGNPIVPYDRISKFEISLVEDIRSDRGRVEYWACYCTESSIKTIANYF